jgi:hypothetical protein
VVTVAIEAPAEPTASATDEFLHSWVRWREACESVRSAYGYWATCEQERRESAFAGYVAALDREEHAARIHWRRARVVEQAQ